jgi:hypothetical protein
MFSRIREAMRSRPIVYPMIVAILSLIAGSMAAADVSVTPSALLARPSFYDGKHIAVTGKVQHVEERTPQSSSPYAFFELCDAKCVRVMTWGHPAISDGQRLAVHGTFTKVKGPPGITFRSQIEASYVFADDNSL